MNAAPPEAASATGLEPMPLIAPQDLPRVTHLAATLSDPSARIDSLMTMIAVATLMENTPVAAAADPAALEARFIDDRAWLDRLALHYIGLPMRGTHLDSSAWFVLDELELHQLAPGPDTSPLGPDAASLMRRLFDRSDERLAAAVLPEVLRLIEIGSTTLWSSLLDTVAVNEPLLAVVTDLYPDWFSAWMAYEIPAPGAQEEPVDVIALGTNRLQTLVGDTILPGPLDDTVLQVLRFDLLSALPGLNALDAKDAAYLLILAGAVDGLNEGRYLAFTESLLWVVSDLLLQQQAKEEIPVEAVAASEAPVPVPVSRVPRLLTDILPWLSNTFSGEFSDVDPRINSSLAAVFDAAQYLQSNQHKPERLTSLKRGMGDAISQLSLLLPKMSYYFDQPVRRRISEEIDSCASAAADTDSQGFATMSREQFDDCLESLVEMSADEVSKEELSGDIDGPFGAEQVRRELMMPPWQRINFTLGYLHDRFPTACELPANPLPNPLEWSSLANMFAWLARQGPVFFQTPENEALVLRMRQQGIELLREITQQVDCISGQSSGINDPVSRGLADYRLALGDLVAGIREAELEFRAERLKPGADAVLHGDASQKTAYRTEDLIIGPCNPDRICEMSGQLEATRALIGLFPDPYLIADQTGLGSIEICYDNMQWINRHAEPVRADDPHVANYFGQLSFDLVGRYRESGVVTDVFGSNFTSPDEYHYLFAAATEEVLEDSCPTEWVGTKIVTSLGSRNAIRVVPDRLTYLASIRKRPSEVINSNWSRGAEWRDGFVTAVGVTPHEYAMDETISGRVNQHLQSLYQAQQSVIYTSLLRPESRGGRNDSLLELQEELTARKALVRSYINLFNPDLMVDSDEIRASLEGYNSLLDNAVLRRFREGNTAVASINDIGLSRLEEFQVSWNRLPDPVRRSGSIAISLAHAIVRLDSLYFDFFVQAPEQTGSMAPVGLND